MAELSNPYSFQSPIGAALANFSKTLMSGPDEATKLARTEAALKLRRENENAVNVGNVFLRYGQPGFDRNTAAASALAGGIDPSKLAEGERYLSANTYGATDPRTSNAFVGAGGAYGSSPAGFSQTLAENQRQFNMKPQTIGTPTGPVIVPLEQAYNQPAVEDIGKVKGDFARRAINSPTGINNLSPNEQRFVGAAPANQTPRMYMSPDSQRFVTYDGVTDARTGQPLPAGGSMFNVQGDPNSVGLRPQVQGDLQKADIENQKFRNLLDYTRSVAKQSPSNFGIAGMVKGTAQDVTQMAQNLAEGLGYTGLQQAVEAAKAKAIASGVDPQSLPGLFNFDPHLPALHTASDLLVYQAASALAGQSGRSVSDRDVKMFSSIVGDPREWFGNQQKYLSKLDTIDQILSLNQGVIDNNLRRGTPSPAAPAAPGASPPNPPAPGAPPTADGPTATNPQTGQKVILRNGQWVPVQ